MGVAVAVVRFTLKRFSVLSTANPIWSAAALLTEKWGISATRNIAAKPVARSVHLSRGIGVPSLGSNAGVISAPMPTAGPSIHIDQTGNHRLTPRQFAVLDLFLRFLEIIYVSQEIPRF